jgi:hypothetical protein
MALVVMTRKAYVDQPGTDYPNLAGKAKLWKIASPSSADSTT